MAREVEMQTFRTNVIREKRDSLSQVWINKPEIINYQLQDYIKYYYIY